MNDRKTVETEKGYRNPNIGQAPAEAAAEAAAELSPEELAAAEEAAAADAEAAAFEEAERKRKSVDPEKCKVQGPALLKCIVGCRSSFHLQCIAGGGNPVAVADEDVQVTVEQLASEEDTKGEPVELERESLPLGKFMFKFVAASRGHYLLKALVQGIPVPGSPFKVWVVDAWKTVKMDHGEESVFPGWSPEMTTPCWVGDMMVVASELNTDPDNEHSMPKMELHSMDRNGSWETWTSYGLASLPDDQCQRPRRYGAAVSVADEQAMIMFGGVRDGKKDPDAKKSDPYPQILLQEPMMVLFQGEEVMVVPPENVEGPMPPARYGHCMGRIDSTFVLFGGTVKVDEETTAPDNDTWFLQLKDDGATWHWIKPPLSGRRPKARSRAGMCIHRRKLFVFGGVDANGELLHDVHCLEMGANPTWHHVHVSGEAPAGGAGVANPMLMALDDPDKPQFMAYGGYASTEAGSRPSNSVHLLDIDPDLKRGVWRELHSAADSAVVPECLTAYHDGVFYNLAAPTKPKLPGEPRGLDEIHQIMPSAVMQPTVPHRPEVVRELGNACVLSWDTDGTHLADTFVNQYLLEADFGLVGSPFMQVYTGSETTAKVGNLVPGRLYTFRVRASNGASLSEFSATCQYEAGEAPAQPEPEDGAPEDEVTEEDWYEVWLEDERLRKEAEKKRRVMEAAADKKRRAADRDYHERLIDQHYIAAQKLEETQDHFAALHGDVCGLLTRRDSAKTTEAAHKPVVEAGRQLNKVVQDVADRLRELEAEEDHREATREQMQTRLDHKVAAAELVHQRFHNFKREIAMEAENSRSGRKIPEAQLDGIEKEEREKDEELKAVRLKNIVLKHELARLESWLQSKEVLGEGLHLIDFEQLKIENQTLNEKIEERNEELLKLRKKNTQTVQVLTHIKEKLQFVQADNQLQKDNLANLETDLALRRDELAQHKKALDQIRHDRYKLKEKSGLVDSDDLLYDFEKTKDRITDLKQQLRTLHQRAKTAQQHTKLVIEEQVALSGGLDGGMGAPVGAAPLSFQG